ncbi:MAG: histidine phosphatase family protein [Armatimonadota bacterium]|nr:histidine phosphatase family protein [Armatimonadota bacterium]
MVKLILVRHGQTTWNAEDRLQGQLDPELSELGLRQAAAAADALAGERVDAVYSSDLRRALTTALLIAEKRGLPVDATPLLREVNLGAWQGLTLVEVQARYPTEYAAYREDSVANRPPGAERLEDLIDRARRFIETVVADCAAGNIVVVAHGGIIRGALCCALDGAPTLYRRVKLDNGGFTTIGFSSSGPPHIFAVNETCHLREIGETETVQEL